MPAFETVGPNGERVLWPSRKKCKQVAPQLERRNRFRRRAILRDIRAKSEALNRKMLRKSLDEEAAKRKQEVQRATLWQKVKEFFRGKR